MTKLITKTVFVILLTISFAILSISNLKAQDDVRAFNWIKWCGTYSGLCIGTSSGGALDWKAGARWTSLDLIDAGVEAGDKITKVRFSW